MLEIELDSIKNDLVNLNKSKNNNDKTDTISITFLRHKIKQLEEIKKQIEIKLNKEIEDVKDYKIKLENEIKTNELKSIEYTKILNLYNDQTLELNKLKDTLQECNDNIIKYVNDISMCSNKLNICSNDLQQCKADLGNKEIIVQKELREENEKLKKEIINLKSNVNIIPQYANDEIIVIDSNSLAKNTKLNTISKLINTNDDYSNFLKKNKRIE